MWLGNIVESISRLKFELKVEVTNIYKYSDPQSNMSINNSSSHLMSLSVIASEFAGIKMSSLQTFIDECGGNSMLGGLTIADAYDLYGEIAISPNAGVAQVFVSFSWNYRFLDAVAKLQRHFRDNQEIVIWMDFFAISTNVNLENFLLKKQFKHIVLMPSPRNGYAPLKRISCNSGCKCMFDSR